jgi:ABC-type tungstate transport system substrate-binding protein
MRLGEVIIDFPTQADMSLVKLQRNLQNYDYLKLALEASELNTIATYYGEAQIAITAISIEKFANHKSPKDIEQVIMVLGLELDQLKLKNEYY